MTRNSYLRVRQASEAGLVSEILRVLASEAKQARSAGRGAREPRGGDRSQRREPRRTGAPGAARARPQRAPDLAPPIRYCWHGVSAAVRVPPLSVPSGLRPSST